jgi:hypothetical protein
MGFDEDADAFKGPKVMTVSDSKKKTPVAIVMYPFIFIFT